MHDFLGDGMPVRKLTNIFGAIALLCAALTAADAQHSAARAQTSRWGGFYIGANGGYAFSNSSMSVAPNDAGANVLTASGLFQFPDAGTSLTGGFGGLQAGHNWAIHQRWVVGLEADIQFGNIKSKGSTATSNVLGLATVSMTEKATWFGTLRPRLGYLVTNDWLLYGTGGLALTRIDRSGIYDQPTAVGSFGGAGGHSFNCLTATCFSGDELKTQIGLALGAGSELRIAERFTIKGEYMYVDFGSETLLLSATPLAGTSPAQWAVDSKFRFHTLRLGLNYQFN